MAQRKGLFTPGSTGNKLLIVILAFALVGGVYAAWRSLAAKPPLATIEAETMTASTTDGTTPAGAVVSDASSSGGRVFQFSHNGELKQTFTLSAKANVVKVYVRDSSVSTNTKKHSPCSVPSLVQLYLNDRALTHQFRVVNTNWKVRGQMEGRNVPAGTYTLKVDYQHDTADSTCQPQLMVDKVDFFFRPSDPPGPQACVVNVVDPSYVDPSPNTTCGGGASGYDDNSPTQGLPSPTVVPDQPFLPADPGTYSNDGSGKVNCHPGYQCVN